MTVEDIKMDRLRVYGIQERRKKSSQKKIMNSSQLDSVGQGSGDGSD